MSTPRKTITIYASPTRTEITAWANTALRNSSIDGLDEDFFRDFADGLPALMAPQEAAPDNRADCTGMGMSQRLAEILTAKAREVEAEMAADMEEAEFTGEHVDSHDYVVVISLPFTRSLIAELTLSAQSEPVEELPKKWSEWSGEGPAPASWMAVDPQSGASVKVYRSYEDYVLD